MPLILLVIGIGLIIYNYRSIKKENAVKQENDSLNISFQSVLQDNKEELKDYKMEIGILRRDIAESLTELQEEIVDIKNNLNMLKKNSKAHENKEDIENDYFIDKDLSADSDIEDEVISEITFSQKADSDKTQKIKELLNKGLTEEEICHELSVSKGEVLLVKGLFKK